MPRLREKGTYGIRITSFAESAPVGRNYPRRQNPQEPNTGNAYKKSTAFLKLYPSISYGKNAVSIQFSGRKGHSYPFPHFFLKLWRRYGLPQSTLCRTAAQILLPIWAILQIISCPVKQGKFTASLVYLIFPYPSSKHSVNGVAQAPPPVNGQDERHVCRH